MNIALRPIALVAGLTALPFAVLAHFKLLEPAEWVKTNDLGDPQKAGPCGLPDTNGDNAKFLTDASAKVTGGSKLHLKIQEAVFHSGHYRVALAVNSRNGEVDRERSVLDMGADSEPTADSGACRWSVPALCETG